MKTIAPLLLWTICLPIAAATFIHPVSACLLVLILLHIAVNIVVCIVSNARYSRWARVQPWTEAGCLPGFASYSEGEGEDAILLVHGFCDPAYVWKRQAERISAQGFHVEALQLKGGLLPKLQLQLTERLTVLAANHRRVFVMAHSFGCSLALDAVYRHTRYNLAPISGIVLFAPLFRPMPTPRWHWEYSTVFAIRRFLLPLQSVAPSMFREVVKGEDDPDFGFKREAFMSVYHVEELLRMLSRLQKLDRSYFRVPTKVFLAGDDRLVDSEASRKWLSSIPAPCEISVVPEAKHALLTARSWRETCDAAIGFIRSVV